MIKIAFSNFIEYYFTFFFVVVVHHHLWRVTKTQTQKMKKKPILSICMQHWQSTYIIQIQLMFVLLAHFWLCAATTNPFDVYDVRI